MELIPDSYRCQRHQADLTALVVEQLEDRVPVAFGFRRAEGFRVLVTCPGTAGQPPGGTAAELPHEVGCTGRVRYQP